MASVLRLPVRLTVPNRYSSNSSFDFIPGESLGPHALAEPSRSCSPEPLLQSMTDTCSKNGLITANADRGSGVNEKTARRKAAYNVAVDGLVRDFVNHSASSSSGCVRHDEKDDMLIMSSRNSILVLLRSVSRSPR